MATITKQDLDQIQLIDEKLSNAILLRADTIDSKKHIINDMIEEGKINGSLCLYALSSIWQTNI